MTRQRSHDTVLLTVGADQDGRNFAIMLRADFPDRMFDRDLLDVYDENLAHAVRRVGDLRQLAAAAPAAARELTRQIGRRLAAGDDPPNSAHAVAWPFGDGSGHGG